MVQSFVSVVKLLVIVSVTVTLCTAFPQTLSNVEVAETPIENSENEIQPINSNTPESEVVKKKPSIRQDLTPKPNTPPKNFGNAVTNLFKKFLPSFPTNNQINTNEDFQNKLRTLLGNRHIYLELLHQFTPHPWFKPFHDKIKAIQDILKDPNFSLPNDTSSNSQGSGSTFGCGWFPNSPSSSGGFPQKDEEANVENGSFNGTSSSNDSQDNGSSSGGSKFFTFGSRPAPTFDFSATRG